MSRPLPRQRPLALVTGASSGIGLAIARELARSSFDLVVVAKGEHLDPAARDLRSLGADVQQVRADLATAAGVETVWAAVEDRSVAAAVLNAGVGFTSRSSPSRSVSANRPPP